MYYREDSGKFRIAPLRMSAKHFSRRWPMSRCPKHIVLEPKANTFMNSMTNTPHSCPLQM